MAKALSWNQPEARSELSIKPSRHGKFVLILWGPTPQTLQPGRARLLYLEPCALGASNAEGAAGFALLPPPQCPPGPNDVMGPKVVTGERGSQGDASSPAARWSESHAPHYILRKQTS